MANEAKYWILANVAAKQLGWFPEVIFSQWTWETGHFISANLANNNNIAGQTWYSGCGYPQGSARPASEGGHYIKYPDVVTGYVSFVKKNIGRYGNVAKQKTIEGQMKQIAADGWAADKNYANNLIAMHKYNQQHRFYNLPRAAAVKTVTSKPVSTKPIAKQAAKAAPKPHYYVVKHGDTLSAIAATHHTTTSILQKLNGLKDPDLIKENQKLRIS